MTDNKDTQKDVAHYQLLIQTWVDSNMERDRTLIQISAAGIGLLVTLLSTVGISSSCQVVLYFLASIAFLITILACVIIFRRNAAHIEAVLEGRSDEDKILRFLDYTALTSFILALMLSLSIGAVTAHNELLKQGENVMSQDKDRQERMIKPDTEIQKESINNIGRIRNIPSGDSAKNPPPSQAGQDSTSQSSDKR